MTQRPLRRELSRRDGDVNSFRRSLRAAFEIATWLSPVRLGGRLHHCAAYVSTVAVQSLGEPSDWTYRVAA